ncbi:hypothetical protein [Dysgonomonas sp. BGC7]|uniref:hypothetical protein n=1 Tax=Dysgonomonas sp. BGC7 TaxID=1658008 RepID=UPI000682BC31|nr:hypothetical protein [Dysgonomonas sp. BGC7]MBD8390134.1 hypothetical protein [Dysgonomonas sp. BGC7]
MSSRRKLKKNINNIMDLLYIDCIFYKTFVIDADKAAADKVIEKIATAHDDLLKRVSCTEGKEVKGRVKAYYNKLRADIKNQTNDIARDIAALGE